MYPPVLWLKRTLADFSPDSSVSGERGVSGESGVDNSGLPDPSLVTRSVQTDKCDGIEMSNLRRFFGVAITMHLQK